MQLGECAQRSPLNLGLSRTGRPHEDRPPGRREDIRGSGVAAYVTASDSRERPANCCKTCNSLEDEMKGK